MLIYKQKNICTDYSSLINPLEIELKMGEKELYNLNFKGFKPLKIFTFVF